MKEYTPEDIERIRREGINADQENKTDWEEYMDAIASKQIIDEYDKKQIRDKEYKVSDNIGEYKLHNLMNEKPPVYDKNKWKPAQAMTEEEMQMMNASVPYVDETGYHVDWQKSCTAVMKEKMEIEQKILQWYKETGDEKYAQFMNIEAKRQGEI